MMRYIKIAVTLILFSLTFSSFANENIGFRYSEGAKKDDKATSLISEKIVKVVTSKSHACAIGESGKLYCWGYNPEGQLGINSNIDSLVPKLIYDDIEEGTLKGEKVIDVAVGAHHSCAISASGMIYCWGDNSYGQLGTIVNNSRVPVLIKDGGLLEEKKAVSITARNGHNCAINELQVLYCWGDNSRGQLGTNYAVEDGPQKVFDIDEVNKVVAGEEYTCAIDNSGKLYCWGDNHAGQLGINSDEDSPIPQKIFEPNVGSLEGTLNGEIVIDVAAGTEHTCAINEVGRLYCWGFNDYGRLGTVSTDGVIIPAIVPLLGNKKAEHVALGEMHSCAISDSGELYCWGNNPDGQLAIPMVREIHQPDAIYDKSSDSQTGLIDENKVILSSAAGDYTCAINESGELYCWGKFSSLNQAELIYDESTVSKSGLLDDKPINNIAANNKHICATNSEGMMYCWGVNTFGSLGLGIEESTGTPSTVYQAGLLEGKTAADIAVGYWHSCAISSDSRVYCCGVNSSDTLGVNSTSDIYQPTLIYDGVSLTGTLLGEDAASITSGEQYSCAIGTSGKLYCWGSNSYGQLGINSKTTANLPTLVYDGDVQTGFLGGKKVIQVSSGRRHTCAISEIGKLYCWGYNSSGQLGINSKTTAKLPTLVYDGGEQTGFLGGKRVISVSAGYNHTCAINELNKAYCWGNNGYGQLGNNSQGDSLIPVLIHDGDKESGLLDGHKVVEIVSGNEQTCAINDEGRLYCWSSKYPGALGIVSYESQFIPAKVYDVLTSSQTGLLRGEKVKKAALGDGQICALSESGKAYCWGDNSAGQLGISVNIPQLIVFPEDEICADDVDNDLDYTTDEEACSCINPDNLLNTTCSNGQFGVCATEGTYVCNTTSGLLECNAVPGHPKTVTCANIDTTKDLNCDGKLDTFIDIANYGDECTGETVGFGVCANNQGTKVCQSGKLICQVEPLNNSTKEVCGDKLDNDCDGETDEGCEPSPTPTSIPTSMPTSTPVYDECPNDPNKTEAGVCGCGIKDGDVNHNNIIDCYDPKIGGEITVDKETLPLPVLIVKKGKRKLNIYMQRFNVKGNKKLVLKYRAVVQFNPKVKSSLSNQANTAKAAKRKITKFIKKNNFKLAINKKGTYKIRYRVDVVKGKKTIIKSKWSPFKTIKIINGEIVN